MKKFINFLIFILFLLLGRAYGQTNDAAGSRIYFPELYGLNSATNTANTQINSGLLFSSAVEYRFNTSNWFVRFNYDELNNKYTSLAPTNYSNIISGKLSNDFLLLGAGYRIKKHKMAYYALCQPALAISGYSTATQNPNGISLVDRSATNPGLKLALGAEYYFFNGFAINAEPAYYNIFGLTGPDHGRFHTLSLSLGITTTLF